MILRMLTGLSDWLSIRSAKVRFFFQYQTYYYSTPLDVACFGML